MAALRQTNNIGTILGERSPLGDGCYRALAQAQIELTPQWRRPGDFFVLVATIQPQTTETQTTGSSLSSTHEVQGQMQPCIVLAYQPDPLYALVARSLQRNYKEGGLPRLTACCDGPFVLVPW
jgi:hypothetical protein